jgi:uncharacterized membrane protein YeaQ/YmgE (transglycosylase-associated protein family)
MVVFVWIILGMMAGLVATKVFHHAGGLAMDLILGIAGAIGGGLAVNSLGFPQPSAFIVAGAIGATVGAAALLAGYRAIFRPA